MNLGLLSACTMRVSAIILSHFLLPLLSVAANVPVYVLLSA